LEYDLAKGSIKSHIFKIALPAMIGYFFHTMLHISDTYFAGIISSDALGALSVSASIFFIIMGMSFGISEAISALIANVIGENNISKARNIFLNSVLLTIALAFIFTILGLISVPFLIDFLGDFSYRDDAINYISILLFGYIFMGLSFMISSSLSALGDTKSFRNITIMTLLLNIVLNYILIIYLNQGVVSLAISTIFCEFITLIYLSIKLKNTNLYTGLSEFKIDYSIIKHLLIQGLPPSINLLMIGLGMYIITYFISSFGDKAIIGFGIGMRIEQIFLLPIIGINIATLSIISQSHGAKKFSRIKKTLTLVIKYGFIISTLQVILFLLFAENIIALLTQDEEAIKHGALYLKICGLSSFAFVIIFAYISMLQGINKPSIIIPVSIIQQIIAPVIAFSILLQIVVPIHYIWISLDIIIFLSSLFLYLYGNKKIQKIELSNQNHRT